MNPAAETTPLSTTTILRLWAPHLAATLLPAIVLSFLLTAPHGPLAAFLWLLIPGVFFHLADRFGGTFTQQPEPRIPAWPFDGLVLFLVAVQFLNIFLLGTTFAAFGFWRLDTLAAVLLVGGSSGYSGIVVAHELIHRASPTMQLLGRALLCSVMYEHFYTEHIRGHHSRVGTADDPATARFGEAFLPFFLRTVPAQFRSAWRLEAKRLGDADMPLTDPRLLRSRVVHGLVAEWSLALVILAGCGVTAFAIFLLQAAFAIRALEVVNYFEHWGLTRSQRRVRPVDSWDTHSRFTYFALTGLTRHADHHAYAARPYQSLRVHPEAPVLPRGYIALFPLVLARNAKFRELMTAELQRRKLGPFAEDEVGAQ